MSYVFEDEDKVANEFNERIPFGISEVQFVGATAGETEAGKDFIEVTVTDKDGLEDSARVWFVGGAAKFSFDTLRQIAVHIAKDDKAKEKARMAVENVKDNDELAELLNKNCIGGHLWFTKYFDPSRTYQGSDGVTRRSINNSVLGYEPKLKPELMPDTSGGRPVSSGVEDVFPGAEIATGDAAAKVPKKSDW